MSGITMLDNELVFNSIHELTEALDTSKIIDSREDSSEQHGGRDWCDTSNYNEARMFLEVGRLYDNLGIDIEQYRTKGTVEKRINKLSVVGHNVVVPLFLQGIPNCMITNKKVINNKIVTIFYNPVASAGTSQSEMIKGATRLFKNIISLEEQGYRVNLYVLDLCRGSGDKIFAYCLKLKNDRETLNIKKMCFPLVSSSMLRRIGFRVRERLYKDWVGWGYGHASFNYNDNDNFIKKHLKLRNYEIWTYTGKKER